MYSNTAARASARVRNWASWTCSVLSEAKKLSMGALSKQLPRRLIDGWMPCRSSTARYGPAAYWVDPAVAMMNEPPRRPAALEGHDQGVDTQACLEVIRHRPADDLARGQVLDGGQVEKALVGWNVRDVG